MSRLRSKHCAIGVRLAQRVLRNTVSGRYTLPDGLESRPGPRNIAGVVACDPSTWGKSTPDKIRVEGAKTIPGRDEANCSKTRFRGNATWTRVTFASISESGWTPTLGL